jgi:uncharacterized protein YdiU (UPF0061 family)
MLGVYDEDQVFSSIDEYGRYAFGKQGRIAHWNMARLADCLLPLLIEAGDQQISEDEQEQQAVAKVEKLIHQFTDKYEKAYFSMYAKKLGLNDTGLEGQALINDLLTLMKTKKLDYTQTFLLLTESLTDKEKAEELKSKLGEWYLNWFAAIKQEETKKNENPQMSFQPAEQLMRQNNPVVIPRNHHIEKVLETCEDIMGNDLGCISGSKKEMINDTVNQFLRVLKSPYQEMEGTKKYQDTSKAADKNYRTFCGT